MLRSSPTRIPPRLREWLAAQLTGTAKQRRRPRRKACLYVVGRIGDFVLMLSALRLILTEYGQKNCTLIIAEATLPLAVREFPQARLFCVPGESTSLLKGFLPLWWRQREKLSADHYDRFFCLRHQRDPYHEMIVSWIATDQLIKLERATYPITALPALCTELIAHQRVVEIALGHSINPAQILPQFTTQPTRNDGRLLVYPLSRDSQRCLPITKTIAALRLWRDRSSAPIIFSGSLAEAQILAEYRLAAQQAKIEHVGLELPVSLSALVEQIAQAGVVLTVETAAVHIATALDKPTIAVLGGGIYGLCYPWRRSQLQLVVQHHLPCFGCGWRCTETEQFCLTQLTPAMIADALPAL